ncbi:MAG: ATP-binding cassette domain-containing protein [Bifidobacteriaceae bacterium]|jgi:zinc transport system ATP-binding protein|nr:ATP-binding cassette domain-containing protein [Bifidobacteriaceae bacterium]
MSPVLQANNLAVSRQGVEVFGSLTFAVPAGQVSAIVGANGSGKTTFLEATLGLLPFQGELQVLGQVPPQANRKIGYVSQGVDHYRTEFLRVRDLLTINQRSNTFDHDDEAFNLGVNTIKFHLDDRMSELSMGQAQKAAIVGALAGRPQVLFLDEPFSGLDPKSSTEIIELLGRLNQEQQLSIFIVTHDIHKLEPILSSVLRFEDHRATYYPDLTEALHDEGHHA